MKAWGKPNTCTICGMQFHSFGDYHEHALLGHRDPFKAFQSGRTDLVKVPYPGPMDKDVKAATVAKGEQRLGRQNFYGSI